jgi:hypothetical protein
MPTGTVIKNGTSKGGRNTFKLEQDGYLVIIYGPSDVNELEVSVEPTQS